ncbi:aldo/keto reductase [Citricoccus muralis]|uniref:Diketogulonate reductase-like aldo/keto reductase n=1 Tax=Citricoccus muralis TaxID=169134 RepID=A0A3D9LBU6_9MICC|nr:aldo/keto reductase [Citricoccus muralis]REE03861.1 diketogulonate reductase-like aldo/keto reductase [Citricoccus muralis]
MVTQRYALLSGTGTGTGTGSGTGSNTSTSNARAAVQIPLIGLGTWPLTGTECSKAVTSALEAGYRHVDTAENYRNEDAVGRAVVGSGISRDEVFVTSKFNREWHGPVDTVRAGLEAGLERAGLDYFDLYLVHWPNPGLDRYVQACESLAELTESGLIRSWGVSNFKPSHLQRLLEAGLVPSVNQIHCQPTDAQQDVQEANTAAGVLTAAYTPIGRGSELLDRPEITSIASRLGRTPAQVVLRWHVQQGRIAVPKSADPQRQRENLDVFSFELTADDLAAVDALDAGVPSETRQDADVFGH